ncbi:MAG: hypothetical protein B6240_15195 [Desulfobacteraceae bacterium 4572_87]|nr:MAG: hypothetical protein B6240_15195 [Desulfobacteraceae bacterium 4572_87]
MFLKRSRSILQHSIFYPPFHGGDGHHPGPLFYSATSESQSLFAQSAYCTHLFIRLFQNIKVA